MKLLEKLLKKKVRKKELEEVTLAAKELKEFFSKIPGDEIVETIRE